MTLDELEIEIKKDFKIDEFDLAGESRRNDDLFSKYLGIFKNERRKLQELNIKRKKLIFIKKEYYSGQSSEEVYKEFPLDKRYIKTEINDVIENDDEVIKINYSFTIQELKVKMLEKVMIRIEKRGYDIKNAIDYLKFTQGV